MTRQEALNVIWRRLLVIFATILTASIAVALFAGNVRVPTLLFLFGNIGGYVGIHKNLGELKNDELVELSGSWLGIVVPSFVGGILALLIYLLFLSGILGGDLFPKFEPDAAVRNGFDAIFDQHAAGSSEYAKLLFWGFVAGFNQKYVVDVIDSIKNRV
jgi:hypothetical protein